LYKTNKKGETRFMKSIIQAKVFKDNYKNMFEVITYHGRVKISFYGRFKFLHNAQILAKIINKKNDTLATEMRKNAGLPY